MDFKEELKIRANYAEEIIKKYMPEEVGYQKTIMEAMNYSLSSGGKRLRPVLTLEACRIVGGDTDNAIPFAAADPARVIPASIIGAGIAGGLSMFFGVQLPAPHGGLFVIPVVTNPIMYLVSIAAGSVITAVILGYIKKPVAE